MGACHLDMLCGVLSLHYVSQAGVGWSHCDLLRMTDVLAYLRNLVQVYNSRG